LSAQALPNPAVAPVMKTILVAGGSLFEFIVHGSLQLTPYCLKLQKSKKQADCF